MTMYGSPPPAMLEFTLALIILAGLLSATIPSCQSLVLHLRSPVYPCSVVTLFLFRLSPFDTQFSPLSTPLSHSHYVSPACWRNINPFAPALLHGPVRWILHVSSCQTGCCSRVAVMAVKMPPGSGTVTLCDVVYTYLPIQVL